MLEVLKLTILTPERNFYSGEVVEVLTESVEGSIAILPNHMPLVTTLRPTDTVITQKDGKKLMAFTSTGILQVKNNELKILCDDCEWPEEVDKKRAEEAKKRAEERLKNPDGGIDVKRAQLALARALARINLK
ncbi:F0F1 ATP synthase subunit epsilon [Clostridium sp. cel8]|jgi:F-type H+-transporting ATPase subunit epsilon|uniref:F0F1 ATP synthase subunit epsilon n=1 Tax=Clostridium sp. cel8 TaxID=2663123 RepID=UPI0015F68437|nr:F0F1 ATP synthase subunit epsilon [Clostridium sp. cel8]MBA5851492.1 F0F1 ATP synthase subunit epsilon [Clostridium sp. cel8]